MGRKGDGAMRKRRWGDGAMGRLGNPALEASGRMGENKEDVEPLKHRKINKYCSTRRWWGFANRASQLSGRTKH